MARTFETEPKQTDVFDVSLTLTNAEIPRILKMIDYIAQTERHLKV